MVRSLLIWGMLAGICAGLLAASFAWVFGEPQVDLAIAFEKHPRTLAHEIVNDVCGIRAPSLVSHCDGYGRVTLEHTSLWMELRYMIETRWHQRFCGEWLRETVRRHVAYSPVTIMSSHR